MRRILPVLLAALSACCGCSKSGVMTPHDFTVEFAESLAEARPELNVTIVGDLEVKAAAADGNEFSSYLDNAYDLYRQNPESKADLFQRYIAAGLQTLDLPDGLDRTRIVPVVKDRPWLAEMREALLSRGAPEAPEFACEDLNRELVIVYAEDHPDGIRYLTQEELETAEIAEDELREFACENLRRLLPSVEFEESDGIYLVTAGGNYEGSLLLFDSIWTDEQFEVSGEIVVALPAREVLLVTGSEDPEGIARVQQTVADVWKEAPYRLTDKLFVYRDGKFEVFTPPVGSAPREN